MHVFLMYGWAGSRWRAIFTLLQPTYEHNYTSLLFIMSLCDDYAAMHGLRFLRPLCAPLKDAKFFLIDNILCFDQMHIQFLALFYSLS